MRGFDAFFACGAEGEYIEIVLVREKCKCFLSWYLMVIKRHAQDGMFRVS